MSISQTLLLKLLMLQLLCNIITTTSSISAASSAAAAASSSITHFQILNVKESINGSITKPKQISQNNELFESHGIDNSAGEAKWKLKLVHRERLSSTNLHDHRQRFHARMQRDVKRVATLVRRLSGGGANAAKYEIQDFGTDVVSGMDQGSGEYFVRLGIGSPPRSQYMVIDSGSDIVWVQCQPCSQCFKQSDPVFDPAASASFSGVSCSSTVCDRIENAGCLEGQCRYEVSYGDGSYTKGTLALETLTIGRTFH